MSLREFTTLLDREGELKRIKCSVNPELEISEVFDRVSKEPKGGSALLFEDTGTGFPMLCNMMGSEKRLCRALRVENSGELSQKIERLLNEVKKPRTTLSDKLSILPFLSSAAKWFPKHKRRRGKCQEVVYQGDEVDLAILPILKTWPHDGGRFITLPLVHTTDPATGGRNVGMYRMQVFSKNSTGMHWHIHKTGESHYQEYKRRGQRMPVSVALGGDPAYTYCATAPLPEGIDEYILAGMLRSKPVKLVRCITNNLEVPEDCDIILEGYVDPTEEKVIEGPFGDHTGFYSLEDYYPTFHITAITHRRDAIYPATLVGVPPMEDRHLALASEKIFEAPIKAILAPEILSMWMPWQGVAHNLAMVEINSCYPGAGIKVATTLWGSGQMSFCKVIWTSTYRITEEELKVYLFGGEKFRAEVTFSRGISDVLDHASEEVGLSTKMAIDMTSSNTQEWSIEVVYNKGAESLSEDDKIWLLLAHLEPQRDVELTSDGVIRIDARSKKLKQRATPNVVTMDSKTIEMVDSRWEEYGLGELIASPSRKYQKLVHNDGAEEIF